MPRSMDPDRPPFARIVDSIRARIRSGELGPGDRVPSTREIMREWGVAMATASKVLSALRQEGLIDAVRGVGTVVLPARPSPAEPPTPAAAPPVATNRSGRSGRTRSSDTSARPGRPETVLTREAIVRTAISIVDSEGIDDFSMRRVSAEMAVSTMALYRHVANRTDLVSAMIDATYRDAGFPRLPDADWRHALEMGMRREWEIFRHHPWVVQLSSVAKPFITPAVMAATEEMMGVLTAEGCSPDTALEIVTVLLSFTSGLAAQGLIMEAPDADLASAPERWWHERSPELAGAADRAVLPTVSRVSAPPDIDRIFTIGMESLLDGLTPLIAADR